MTFLSNPDTYFAIDPPSATGQAPQASKEYKATDGTVKTIFIYEDYVRVEGSDVQYATIKKAMASIEGRKLFVEEHSYRGVYYTLFTDDLYYYRKQPFASRQEVEAFIDARYEYAKMDAALDNIQHLTLSGTTIPARKTAFTKAQLSALRRAHRDILEHDGLGWNHMEGYEYKEIRITTYDFKHLYVTTTVGRKDDEGTMGAVFCRNRRHFVIGPRGGIKSLGGRKSKCTNYSTFLIWGADS